MSWDVHLEADLGGPEPLRVGDLDANYTWNVGPMFKAAVGEAGLNHLDGISAAEMREKCAAILAAFNANPEKFRALNPANGWGNFDGAREFIRTIHDACERAPKAIVRVG